MNTSVCPKCKGKGKVVMSFRQEGYEPTEFPCTLCKGSGRK
jgi:DnaJ-class molecular chaperone